MRAIAGAILGPVSLAAILAADIPVGAEAHELAAIAALVVVFWITEPIPIPVTALLGSALCILLGVAPADVVLAPYADPIIFLFLGVFLVGDAMISTGLDGRMARAALSIPGVGSSPRSIMLVVCVMTMLLSMWMNNTAATALMIPLALSAMRGLTPGGGKSATVLGVAYAASIGGIATPIGTVPNLIGIGFLERNAGVHLDFVTWSAVGLPLSVVVMAAFLAVAAVRTPQVAPRSGDALPATRPWTLAEGVVLAVFGLMVAAWVLPSILSLAGAGEASSDLSGRLPESLVGLLGALLLFVLPGCMRPYRPVLPWDRVAGIDWGTIFLFGGGLSLGGLVLKTGLGAWLAGSILDATGVESRWAMIAVAAGAAVLLTEVMSNTAATNVIVPVVFAMATGAGMDPVPPVVAATIGASMAFLLPISTPPNAIAYGTGLVSLPQMMKAGILLDIVAFAAIVAWVGLTL